MENIENQLSYDLLSGFSNGELNSFKKIYSIYFDRVYRFASRFSLSKEDTEEIVQDVFIKLWEKKKLIDQNKCLSGFLFTITQNLVIDKIRRLVATKKLMEKVSTKELRIVASESTEQLVNFYELSNIISKLIDELPSKRRTIFKLSREKCLTYKEISDILKISQGTVEKQMSKALHTLRVILKTKYGIFIDLFTLLPLYLIL